MTDHVGEEVDHALNIGTPLCDPCRDGDHGCCVADLTDAQYDEGDCCCLLDDPDAPPIGRGVEQ